MSPAAVRAFRKLTPAVSKPVRWRWRGWRSTPLSPVGFGGKTVKTIQGAGDAFHRLRVGDHRIMYDVIEGERVILVLGIVHRSDLERWIRNR